MEALAHVNTVIGIILSLSIAHLLKGSVKFVQHPDRAKPYWVHMLWVFYIFLLLIHFWWWEASLSRVKEWYFPEYFFVISYIILFFVICALLFPDDMKDYDGDYERYFYSRKTWFFGALALSFLADIVDTMLKGEDYYNHFTWLYPARYVSHFILCLVAIRVDNRRFHGALVIFFIVYQLYFIFKLYYDYFNGG